MNGDSKIEVGFNVVRTIQTISVGPEKNPIPAGCFIFSNSPTKILKYKNSSEYPKSRCRFLDESFSTSLARAASTSIEQTYSQCRRTPCMVRRTPTLHRRSITARSHHLASWRVAHTCSPVGPPRGQYRELLKEATPLANHSTHPCLEKDSMIKNHISPNNSNLYSSSHYLEKIQVGNLSLRVKLGKIKKNPASRFAD